MSHRYGSRGLPTRILADEFNLLKDEIKSNPNLNLNFEIKTSIFKMKTPDILEHCYQIDENEIPFHYKLKNINKIMIDYNQKV